MKKAKGYNIGGPLSQSAPRGGTAPLGGTPLTGAPTKGGMGMGMGMGAPSSQLSSMGNVIGGVGAPRSAGAMGGSPMAGPMSQSASMGAAGTAPMDMSGGMNRFRGVGPAAAATGMTPSGGGLTMMAKGGAVENPKMSKKVAGYFAKKGNKALAAHERREAAGKEKDTPAIAKREMRALKGAPAGLKSYESKEHSAMGMKRGGMACGGMKKYARGGGIESKGKTQGTMIKMASGGSVSSRADGIASRGKTNCKIC